MVQILFTVFGMGYIYENARIIDNHGTLLHTTVRRLEYWDIGTYQGVMHYAAWLFFYRLAIMPTFSRVQFNCINMCSARITCESGDPRYLMALSYENCAILFHKIA